MATTYLDLTNELIRKFGGVQLTSADFADARNTQAHAKDAIKRAIHAIHTFHYEWPFNALEHSQLLTVGTVEYSWPTNFRTPDWDSFYIVKDDTLGVTTNELHHITKDEWYKKLRHRDLDAGSTGVSVPHTIFQSSGTGYGVSPSPDKAYTLKFSYFRNPPTMTAYSDESLIPTEWDHVIIAIAAVDMYAYRNNAEERRMQETEALRQLQGMRSILINDTPHAFSGMIERPSRGMVSTGFIDVG